MKTNKPSNFSGGFPQKRSLMLYTSIRLILFPVLSNCLTDPRGRIANVPTLQFFSRCLLLADGGFAMWPSPRWRAQNHAPKQHKCWRKCFIKLHHETYGLPLWTVINASQCGYCELGWYGICHGLDVDDI